MPSNPSSLQALFAEMKRRRVFRVMAVYGAVAFVVLQVADIAFEPLGLPDWAMTFVLVLAMLGFPLAIVLAWAFESTPDGMKRTAPAHDEEIRQIVAEPRSRRWPSGLLALASVVLLFGTGWYMGGGGRGGEERGINLVSTAEASDLRTLAALPFEDMNGTEENRLIALGLHDDLLTQLSRVGAIRVTSRTSVRDYVDTEKTFQEIAGELGVQYLLEGTVRSSGQQVRVNVTLVDAESGETLWGEQYDHAVTPENLLSTQSEIARQVIEELEARLTPEEEATLASMRPAGSTVAQQWYFRGVDAWEAGNNRIHDARDAMARAVELDSGYVAAWSGLAKFESRITRLGQDRLAEARAAMERTEQLAPGTVEAHMARGFFEYYGQSNYDAALSAFRAAERLAPSDTEVLVAVGLILRRQGDWTGSTELMRRAVQLDPRNVDPLRILAENLDFMGAYEAADRVFERVLAIEPTNPNARSEKVDLVFKRDRDLGRARRLAGELALDPSIPDEGAQLMALAALSGEYDRAIATLDEILSVPDLVPQGRAVFTQWRGRVELLAGDSAVAASTADSVIAVLDGLRSASIYVDMARGWAHTIAGRREQALPYLEEAERRTRAWADHVDPMTWTFGIIDSYGILGEVDRGLDLLEEIVDRPGRLSVANFRLNPVYEPYRGDPRFDAVIERRERFEAEAANWAEANGPWPP